MRINLVFSGIEYRPRIYDTKVDSSVEKGLYWALNATMGRVARGVIYYAEYWTGFHNDQICLKKPLFFYDKYRGKEIVREIEIISTGVSKESLDRVILEMGSLEDNVLATGLINEILARDDIHLSKESLAAACKLLQGSESPDIVRVFLNGWFGSGRGDNGLSEFVNKVVKIVEPEVIEWLNYRITQEKLYSFLGQPRLLSIALEEFFEPISQQNLLLNQKRELYCEIFRLLPDTGDMEQFNTERLVTSLRLLVNPKFQALGKIGEEGSVSILWLWDIEWGLIGEICR